jgi:hypothetical protein
MLLSLWCVLSVNWTQNNVILSVPPRGSYSKLFNGFRLYLALEANTESGIPCVTSYVYIACNKTCNLSSLLMQNILYSPSFKPNEARIRLMRCSQRRVIIKRISTSIRDLQLFASCGPKTIFVHKSQSHNSKSIVYLYQEMCVCGSSALSPSQWNFFPGF